MERGKYESEDQLHHFIDRSLEKTLRIKSMADQLPEYYLVCAAEWEPPTTECVDADETFHQFRMTAHFHCEESNAVLTAENSISGERNACESTGIGLNTRKRLLHAAVEPLR